MLVTSTCSEMYMANSLELEEIFIYYLQPNAIHYGNSSQLSNKPKDPSRAYVCNLRFLAGKIMVVGYNSNISKLGNCLKSSRISGSCGDAIVSLFQPFQPSRRSKLCLFSRKK